MTITKFESVLLKVIKHVFSGFRESVTVVQGLLIELLDSLSLSTSCLSIGSRSRYSRITIKSS